MDDCIFCKIISKKISTIFIHESDKLVVFTDIHPKADLHLLIVPKKHIKSFRDLDSNDAEMLSEVYETAARLVVENNLADNAYRLLVNGGKAQEVPHLHFHLLGGSLQKMV